MVLGDSLRRHCPHQVIGSRSADLLSACPAGSPVCCYLITNRLPVQTVSLSQFRSFRQCARKRAKIPVFLPLIRE